MTEIIDVESQIEQVCVYRNGALVTRRARMAPGRARITGLPLLYAADSLRVRPAAGQIADLRETCAAERFGPAGRAASAEELERLADALEEVDAEAAALDARSRTYSDLNPTPPHTHHLPAPERLLEMHTVVNTRLAALEAQRMALRDRRRQLEREMEAAQAVVHADPRPPRFTRGVECLLQADAPTDVSIEYFVEAARWVPTYRLDLTDGHAALRLDALIAQATGEDWSAATVRLGTADLERETALPALQSWRIGPHGPNTRPAWRPLPTDLETLFAGFDRAAAPAPEPVTQVRYAVEALESIDEETGAFDVDETLTLVGGMPEMQALGAPPPAPMARSALADDDLSMMPARSRSSGMMSKRRAPPGDAPLDESLATTVQPPGAERLRQLRFAYLRLQGPTEPGRGTLQAVDPLVHLASLLRDHDVEDLDQLQRAVTALRDARARLRNALAPSGTRPTHDGFHHVYAAGGVHDIPSDGFWHRAVVRTDAAPASVDFRCVPRESRDVFRFCTVRTPAGLPYPAGPMQVYIDGTYRVTAPLHAAGGGAPLELNLGLDRAVRVLDRQVEMRQQDKGLMTHTTQVEHTVTLTLRSTLTTPATVQIYDRLPVVDPLAKELDVILLSSQPELERTDKDADGGRLEGGVRWQVPIAPRADATVVHRYRVSFPAKAELVGGNRRE